MGSVSFDGRIYFSPNQHCVVALSPDVHLCKGLISSYSPKLSSPDCEAMEPLPALVN